MKKLIVLEFFDEINDSKNNGRKILKLLLFDQTTKKNIIFATNSYEHLGKDFRCQDEVNEKKLKNINLQPRVIKELNAQKNRTKKHAEVFTPSWICNQMNNHCDEEWFGASNIFNVMEGQNWIETNDKIEFPDGKTWKDYVDSTRLEITCGEAPYIVSRYDTSTGELISIEKRIGILDRKIRVINENVKTQKEWYEYVKRAYQSTYGFEYQSDNLIIGRINLFMTFVEYFNRRFGKNPSREKMLEIANIISWNVWQMDGLTSTVPTEKSIEYIEQLTLHNDIKPMHCCILKDWKNNKDFIFNTLKEVNNE